jgi:hypothetical protein
MKNTRDNKYAIEKTINFCRWNYQNTQTPWSNSSLFFSDGPNSATPAGLKITTQKFIAYSNYANSSKHFAIYVDFKIDIDLYYWIMGSKTDPSNFKQVGGTQTISWSGWVPSGIGKHIIFNIGNVQSPQTGSIYATSDDLSFNNEYWGYKTRHVVEWRDGDNLSFSSWVWYEGYEGMGSSTINITMKG